MNTVKYEDVLSFMKETGMSIRKTAEHFGITRTMPEKASKEIGNRKKKYFLDDTVFDILNDDSMYWLGFLYADGCVNKKTDDNMNLELNISLCDIEHLVKFQKFLKTNYEVKIRKQKLLYKNNEEYQSARITIYGTNFIKKIVELGVTPRKSLTLDIPDIILENEFFYSFIRGYIDGDGCYYNPSKDSDDVKLNLLGTKEVLEKIKTYLLSQGLEFVYISKESKTKDPSKNTFILTINRQAEMLKLINILYRNKECTCLSRKLEKINKFLG